MSQVSLMLRFLDMAMSDYSRFQLNTLGEMSRPEANAPNLFSIYLDRCKLTLDELSSDLDKVTRDRYRVRS